MSAVDARYASPRSVANVNHDILAHIWSTSALRGIGDEGSLHIHLNTATLERMLHPVATGSTRRDMRTRWYLVFQRDVPTGRTNEKGNMAPKRVRETVTYTHCSSCDERMDQLACHIDWHAVWVSKLFKRHMIDTGRIPTQEEIERMDEDAGDDPCDDCCCGACGSRKMAPGTVCC